MWPTHHQPHHATLLPASACTTAAAASVSFMTGASAIVHRGLVGPPVSRMTSRFGSGRPPRSPDSNSSYSLMTKTTQRITPSISSLVGVGPNDVGVPITSPPARPRPLTNTERARNFRLRERAYEQSLVMQIKELQSQIAHLENSRDLLQQRTLMTRTCNGGSLENIARELYLVFRFGLESIDVSVVGPSENDYAVQQARFKETFMRRIVDQDALCGDLVGVETLIDQWRKHTLSYSKFEIEVDHVEPIAGSETNPIVIVRSKLYARFSRGTLPIMFPSVLDERPDLAATFVDRDITFDCVSRFTFSEQNQITIYLIEVNFIEALVKAVGSARDVAELMDLSVVTPYTTLREVKQQQSRSLCCDPYGNDYEQLETSSYASDHEFRREEWSEFGYGGCESEYGSQQLRGSRSYEAEATFGFSP